LIKSSIFGNIFPNLFKLRFSPFSRPAAEKGIDATLRVNQRHRPCGNTEVVGVHAIGHEWESQFCGEEMFKSDTAASSDTFDAGITAAFIAASALYELDDVHCRQSSCRVTYRENRSTPEWRIERNKHLDALLDRISTELGHADLDVHHAQDEQGNPVMYMRVH